MVRPSADCSGPMSAILFSAWQATTHAWHPEHLSRSMTIPQRGIPNPLNVKFQNSKRLLKKFSILSSCCLAFETLTFDICYFTAEPCIKPYKSSHGWSG